MRTLLSVLTITVIYCMLVATTGCIFGDHGVATIVALKLPASLGHDLFNDHQVQEALDIMDGVLVSNGLARDQVSLGRNSNGIIAHYEGKTKRGCTISLTNDEVNVVFFEFGQKKPSASIMRIAQELYENLAKRYGRKQVQMRTSS